MYRRGEKYETKPGRTYFFIPEPGLPAGKFRKLSKRYVYGQGVEISCKQGWAVETYCNALINSNGGMLVFGVDFSEKVVGFELTRGEEDLFKINFDQVINNMKPKIHPHQYRFDVLFLQCGAAVFEIRIAAGDLQEIYENAKREMYVIKQKKLYGPLIPCEIKEIVLEKYKEELSSLIPTEDTCKEIKNKPAKKSRWDEMEPRT